MCNPESSTTTPQPTADTLPQFLLRAAALLRERVERATCPTEHDVWAALTDAGIEGDMRKRALRMFRLVALGQRSATGLSAWIEDNYSGTVVARLEETARVCGRTPAEVLRAAAHLLREKFLPSEELDERDLTHALEDSGGNDETRSDARAALAGLVTPTSKGDLAAWLRKTCRRDVAKAMDRAAETLSPSQPSTSHA